MSLPDSTAAIQAAIDLFNRREYFECHEVLEDLWRPLPPGPEKTFLQGWLQVAVGLLHLQRLNFHGAQSKLSEGLEKLTTVQELTNRPFDLKQFIAQSRQILLRVQSLGPEGLRDFTWEEAPSLPDSYP